MLDACLLCKTVCLYTSSWYNGRPKSGAPPLSMSLPHHVLLTMLTRPIRRSTVDIGRAFELHCLRFLTDQLYMSLTQVGGAGDGGVDLRGWWTVPKLGSTSMSEGRRLRVLGQCKAERKALGPRTVRELEGVMAHQRGVPILWSKCSRS